MAVCSLARDMSVADLTGNREKPTTFDVVKTCIKLANESPVHANILDHTRRGRWLPGPGRGSKVHRWAGSAACLRASASSRRCRVWSV